MISHKYKFIFIHIPKTGGESLLNTYKNEDSNIPKHANARQIKRYLGEKRWKEYYKFTFVRNPWDQVVSMYFHLRKPLYQQEKIIEKYGKTILNPHNACLYACTHSFGEYVYEIFNKKQTQQESEDKKWPINHFAPYLDWITDNKGNIIVDNIGTTENYQQDFNKICMDIGIEPATIPHINMSKRQDYRQYYDPISQEIIGNHYKNEILKFKYKF